MKILNKTKEVELSRDCNLNSYFLTNKKGGFYFGSLTDPFSKFNGLFFPYTVDSKTKEWNMVRTVESLGVDLPVDKIINNLGYISLKKGKVEENFFLNHSDTLVYEVKNFDGLIDLNLDCKQIYDDTTLGRIYKISKSKGCYVISYEKFNDDSLVDSQYKFYLAIKTDAKVSILEKWINRSYGFDETRGEPSLKWLFQALNFNVKGKASIVLSYSTKKKDAIQKALEIFENESYIKKMKVKYSDSLSETDLKLKDEELVAYKNAVCSFDSLISEVNGFKGIYAGLPWFFHFWARDEAISTIALIKEGEFTLAKKILFRWLNHSINGRVSNRFPNAELGSADATGWIFYRLMELIKETTANKESKTLFSKKDLNFIYSECKNRLEKIESVYKKEGLIFNDSLETWMDTGAEVGDLRKGFSIEIQALHVAMYNCLIYVGSLLGNKVEAFEKSKLDLVKNIKSDFYNGAYLFDMKDDATIRPNLFIAAYVAPEILSQKDWKLCFDKALSVLFNEGRILTIPKNHFLFNNTHSGINNHSYHRGDTWFWVDNLVAVVLSRFGKTKYKKYIDAIKSSSIESILYEGAVGSFAEVSSASNRKSEGCLSQAWSYALFIELMNS